MKKIMFNDKYGLTAAVIAGTKTQTRRIISNKLLSKYGYNKYNDRNDDLIRDARYKVGEVVAVAQSYKDIREKSDKYLNEWCGIVACNGMDTVGYDNKMFVRADLMPHKIKITDIRIQRLQDISKNDCLAEGIIKYANGVYTYNIDKKNIFRSRFGTPRVVYADLIDRISGKGTWRNNPYVFVYDFKLVK